MSICPASSGPVRLFVIGSMVVACSAQVENCPEPGETLAATAFVMEAGGKGFNVALAAHRLGVAVDGLFAVGDDPAGAFLRGAFVGHGLDESLLLTVEAGTGAGIGLIQADGENRIAVYPGANTALLADHVTERVERVRNAQLVFAQFEAPDAPIAAAFACAREAGAMTILNPSPYRPIDSAILANTDLLILNEQEAAALCADRKEAGGYDRLAASFVLGPLSRGAKGVIVTRGPEGALAWWQGNRIEQPGLPVTAVDSIGAGDAFTGALIAAIGQGDAFATALRRGCAAGALATTRLGLASALPDRRQIEKALASWN
ncbi:MAG: ribokinase [Sphingobium sp.]